MEDVSFMVDIGTRHGRDEFLGVNPNGNRETVRSFSIPNCHAIGAATAGPWDEPLGPGATQRRFVAHRQPHFGRGGTHATFATLAAVAEALGMEFGLKTAVNEQDFAERQAQAKAEAIARMVQGTSAWSRRPWPLMCCGKWSGRLSMN